MAAHSRRPTRPRWATTRIAPVLLAVSLTVACGGYAGSRSGSDEAVFDAGVRALDAGDFAGAQDSFRRLAARCEAGDVGRTALLALATLHLDLRNGAGSPEEAARLAAVHLNVPDAPADERSLARALYLLAVYRGADPVAGPEELEPGSPPRSDSATGAAVEPTPPPPPPGAEPVPARTRALLDLPGRTSFEPARRFDACGDGPVAWRGVPAYPGTPPSRWTPGDSVLLLDPGVAGHAASLQARVQELEAELERIRKVLRGGGGGGPPKRP